MNNLKKIHLRGAYNCYNFGDDLLLIANLKFLHKFLQDAYHTKAQIYISQRADSLSQLRVEEMTPDIVFSPELPTGTRLITAINNILLPKKMHLPTIFSLWRRFADRKYRQIFNVLLLLGLTLFFGVNALLFYCFKRGLWGKNFAKFLADLDVIHYIGGGYFSDRWCDRLLSEYLTVLVAKIVNPDITVIATGLGIGPLHNRCNRLLARWLFRKFSYIAVREPQSLRLLAEIKVNAGQELLGDDLLLLYPYFARLSAGTNRSQSAIALNLKNFSDFDYSSMTSKLQALWDYPQRQGYNRQYFSFEPQQQSAPDSLSSLNVGVVSHDPYRQGWQTIIEAMARMQIGIGCAFHFCLALTLLDIPVVVVYSGSYYHQKTKAIVWLNDKAIVYALPELMSPAMESLIEALAIGSLPTHRSHYALLHQQMVTRYRQIYYQALEQKKRATDSNEI